MENSTETSNSEGWVWVIVFEADGEEQYLGLYDEDQDVHFIPAFPSKEDANDCYIDLPREKGKKYEIQAVHIEELTQDAGKADFLVALLDGEGNVLNPE